MIVLMLINRVALQEERSVGLSEKARLNRCWNELFLSIQDLSDAQAPISSDENPLEDFLFGHQRLDQYLQQLRKVLPR